MSDASSGHITKLEQSIFHLLIFMYSTVLIFLCVKKIKLLSFVMSHSAPVISSILTLNDKKLAGCPRAVCFSIQGILKGEVSLYG